MPAYSTYLTCFSLLLVGCAKAGDQQDGAVQASIAQRQRAIGHLRIPFGSPVLLDSSVYAMYPLSLSEITKEEESHYSSSSGRSETYWNMAFYNTQTGAKHLLDEHRKMLITSYKTPNDTETSATAAKPAPLTAGANLLYFSIITTDFNHDGQLTEEDPTYLFASDKTGQKLTQLSPDSLHVTQWEIQANTGKLLMLVQQDSNHNHKFEEEDTTIPYLYDLATRQPASIVFDSSFTTKLQTIFLQHWAPKP